MKKEDKKKKKKKEDKVKRKNAILKLTCARILEVLDYEIGDYDKLILIEQITLAGLSIK